MSDTSRIQIRLKGNMPSMYNPFTGQFHNPSSAESHILVNNDC
jgi:hypothetical protein